jgi:hypothetical protein
MKIGAKIFWAEKNGGSSDRDLGSCQRVQRCWRGWEGAELREVRLRRLEVVRGQRQADEALRQERGLAGFRDERTYRLRTV